MINYNGKEFEGSHISINNDGVFVDGKKIDAENMHFSTYTHEIVTNHHYEKKDRKSKSEKFKTDLWQFVKYLALAAILTNVLWGFSTEENPFRNADVIIANLLAYLLVTRKKK